MRCVSELIAKVASDLKDGAELPASRRWSLIMSAADGKAGPMARGGEEWDAVRAGTVKPFPFGGGVPGERNGLSFRVGPLTMKRLGRSGPEGQACTPGGAGWSSIQRLPAR